MTNVFTDTAQANAELNRLYALAADGKGHVTGGRVRLPSIVPGTALVVHEITPTRFDVEDMKRKGVLYKALFLRTLADTAGVHAVSTRRVDDGTNRHIRAMEVTVECVDVLMRRQQFTGRYELDLSDGSERASSMTPGDLKSRRQHIESQATTGAWCRAVVDALALKRGFPASDSNAVWLPIYIPRIEVNAASAPPEMMREISRAAVAQLYGMPALAAPQQQPPQQQPPTYEPEIDVEPDSFADDEVPFADEPPDDEPPASNYDDRPITEDEKRELVEIGCWRKSILAQHGWPGGEDPVMASVYRSVMSALGGAPS